MMGFSGPKLWFVCAVVVVATAWLGLRVYHIDQNCAALDPARIKWETANRYVKSQGKTITRMRSDGGSDSHTIAPYINPEEYLKLYPDCCKFYPKALISGNGKTPLTFWERYVDGMCGFVGIKTRTRYLKDDRVEVSSNTAWRVWIINQNYEILRDQKER